MRRKRLVWQIIVWLLAGVFLGGIFPPQGKAQESGAESPLLTMEELEVRGFREKPGQLYLSVPNQVFLPARVRYDLLQEDLARPILPWEIVEENPGGEHLKNRGSK
ncbi:MAG: hypothetical protein HKM29_05180 [Deltaproteobacteria bacterium]|nr:hypothetical protein [Deltaproteobacteria bacterium]NNG46091.1 hypothetical protein [Deltaproteobacteria bacterium]